MSKKKPFDLNGKYDEAQLCKILPGLVISYQYEDNNNSYVSGSQNLELEAFWVVVLIEQEGIGTRKGCFVNQNPFVGPISFSCSSCMILCKPPSSISTHPFRHKTTRKVNWSIDVMEAFLDLKSKISYMVNLCFFCAHFFFFLRFLRMRYILNQGPIHISHKAQACFVINLV